MRSGFKSLALCCAVVMYALLPAKAEAQSPQAATGLANARQIETYGRLPLSFEPNQGQTSPEVKFLARGPGYGLFLTSTDVVLALKPAQAGARTRVPSGKEDVLRMKLVGANSKPQVAGERQLPGKTNYFFGNDPARWRTDVPQFAGVRYGSVYPGVDLVFYGNQRQLEYDFIVAPGADPRVIRLRFDGTSGVKLSTSGDLKLAAGGNSRVTVRAPVIYQEIDGKKQTVSGRFVLRGTREVAFDIGRYDRSRPLIIDPTVVYSTYLGGSGEDRAFGGVADLAGNVYLVGTTTSANFPLTSRFGEGALPAFVTKLSADGRSVVYSTLVDLGRTGFYGVAVDPAGHAYVTGVAIRSDVPLVNAVQPTCPARDGVIGCDYVMKLSPEGNSLVYATFLGGHAGEIGWSGRQSIAADSAGNTYLVGRTNDPAFPVANAMQRTLSGPSDGVVVKLNPNGAWVYSTFLGGSGAEDAWAVAADVQGNAYVVGVTNSTDFPTLNAHQPAHAPQGDDPEWLGGFPGGDGFVAKLNPSGSALVYSTYLGGSRPDLLTSVAAAADGTAVVAGVTESSDFPTTPGRPAPDPCGLGLGSQGVLAKLGADGQLMFSTSDHVLGGLLALDSVGNIYRGTSLESGWRTGWPLVNPLMSGTGSTNAYVEKLDPTATTVLFSSYWGGSGDCTLPLHPDQFCFSGSTDWLSGMGVDGAGNIYLVGETTNDDFPTLAALQGVPGGTDVNIFWGYPEPCANPDRQAEWDWGVCGRYVENWDVFVVKIAQVDNTPEGQQIAVVPSDAASITFGSVTSPGTTSLATGGMTGSEMRPPVDLRLGYPPLLYEISTTASYTGPITICLDYSKVTFTVEWGLGLYHYENGTWVDITVRPVDTANNRICGVATSLSPFAIFGAPLPPVDVVGLAAPLAAVALQGSPVVWPDKAFKLGRTLPLKLQLLVNGTPLTDQEVKPPTIVQLGRVGEAPLNLDTMDLDAGEANDHGLAFRFADGSWVYNLSTQGLSAGSYVITIQQPDGRRYWAGFALRK